MAHEQIGHLASLATAVLWTLSAVAWTSAGRHIGALAVAFLRLVMAVGFLMLLCYWRLGTAWPSDAGSRAWQMLGLSGFLGFFVSDLCLFKSFLVIGPRRSLLVTSLTPPCAALISWAFCGESLDLRAWLAMGITLAGVFWVVLEQREGESHPHTQRQFRYGVFLALVATVVQAAGMVMAEDGVGDYDPFASAFIRVLGALVGFALLITLVGRWRPVLAAARHGRPMLIVAGGALAGTSLGVTTFMLALQHCKVGIVATILATIPVMILPFSIYLFHDRVSPRAFGGAVVAVAGVALLMWHR